MNNILEFFMKKKKKESTRRLFIFYIASFSFLLILVARLVQIQIFDPDGKKDEGLNQYTRKVELTAERGKILDRNKKRWRQSLLSTFNTILSIIQVPLCHQC